MKDVCFWRLTRQSGDLIKRLTKLTFFMCHIEEGEADMKHPWFVNVSPMGTVW